MLLSFKAEIQDKLNDQPPSQEPIPVKWDVLSQVLGKEKPGRVRGMGAGVTPSRVDAQIQNTSWKATLEAKLEASNKRMTALEDIILTLVSFMLYPCLYQIIVYMPKCYQADSGFHIRNFI